MADRCKDEVLERLQSIEDTQVRILHLLRLLLRSEGRQVPKKRKRRAYVPELKEVSPEALERAKEIIRRKGL